MSDNKDLIIEKLVELIEIYEKEFRKNGLKYPDDYKSTLIGRKIINIKDELASLKAGNKDSQCDAILDKVKEAWKPDTRSFEEAEGMYPEKFVEWFTGKDSPVAILYGDQAERFATKDKDYTISELHQYWLDNIKGK